MKTYQTKIDADVRAVLERSVITATSLVLPAEQLARPLYEKVNKVLVAAGGKWNRGKKAHLFPNDPRAILGLALETGGIVDTKKNLGQFFTNRQLAEYVVNRLNIRHGMRVLEPSAGDGALAIVAFEDLCNGACVDGRVTCVEIDPVYVAKLEAKGCFTVVAGDFLTFKPSQLGHFDRVVMNPPFNGHQDIQHVIHAFDFLDDGGQLAAIMSSGAITLDTRRGEDFRDLVDEHGSWEPLPEGSFVDAGTKVNTILVTLAR